MKCYHCGLEIQIEGKVGRQDTCEKCGSYLHCCLNCRFYDPVAYHECREPQAEWVKDKESGNFCDYFQPVLDGEAKSSSSEQARKKLEQLFGKK